MSVFSGSALGRRGIVAAVMVAVLAVGASARAQQAPAPAAGAPAAGAPAPAPPEDPFKFTTDAALVIWIVKTDKVADFESFWSELRTKAAASDKPEVKSVAESLKLFKADGPATPDGITYFSIMDPAKAPTYSPTVLLYSSGLYPERPAADAMYAKLSGAIAQIRPVGLVKVP